MDVPAFPLQVLLRRRPDWAGGAVAVVERDEPQGRILQVNEEARRRRVLPGQRFAAALALADDLRADVVPDDEIRRAVDETAGLLRRFTPDVEPSDDEPGVFWLEAAGLSRLHPDLRAWAEAIRADLAGAGLAACVVVGFTRFGAYAVARALAARAAAPATVSAGPAGAPRGRSSVASSAAPPHTSPVPSSVASPTASDRQRVAPRGPPPAAPPPAPPDASPPVPSTARPAMPRPAPSPSHAAAPPPAPAPPARAPAPAAPPAALPAAVVFSGEAAERAALRRVPLDRLGIDPDVRDLLAKLGVRTVEGFLGLPAAGLGERFGDAVRRLHRLAAGEVRAPLAPRPAHDPPRTDVALEHPERDGGRLLFLLKRVLDPLLLRTAERREAVAAVEMLLRLDDGSARSDVLRPAEPTLDAVLLLDLVRLRLESVRLAAGATDAALVLHGVPASPAQLELFAEKPKRDLAAADRALARLRAELGDGAVVRARLRDAHLPEASFAWEPLDHVRLPRARAAPRAPLVRRLSDRPAPLPPRPRREPDGWMLRGFEHGNVVRLDGPFVVAGGWWAGPEVRREYHFAETSRGRVFWVFHDVRRRRWFLQGEIS